jgi:hypothetical protein
VTKAGVFRLDCGEIPVMAGGKGGGCQLGLLHYYEFPVVVVVCGCCDVFFFLG